VGLVTRRGGRPSLRCRGDDRHRLHRDRQLLVGGDHHDRHAGPVGRDQARGIGAHRVAGRVDLEPDEVQPRDRLGPHHGIVLADASREREHIETSHHRGVGADVLLQPVHVDVEPDSCRGVAGSDESVHLTHVVVAGQALQAGPAVEQVVDLLDAHPRVAPEVHHDGWIDVTRAGPHDQSLEWGEAHRGVDGGAMHHRRGRCAVPEVQHDLAEVTRVAFEELGGSPRHEPVRGPVGAVAAHRVPLGDLAVDGVGGRRARQVVEERRVEHRDVGDAGEQLAGDVDAGEVGGVVQGGQRRESLDRGDDVGVDERGDGEVLAAHDHAVADRDDARVRQPRAELVEELEHRVQCLAMGGERRTAPGGHPVVGVPQLCHLLADALDDPRGAALPTHRIDQLVLDRGRSAVQDEDGPAHDSASPPVASAPRSALTAWAWIAVMATVLTMSRTVAPRERSFTGLARPCMTGPIATAPADRWTAL
jgi:hypothetical protein